MFETIKQKTPILFAYLIQILLQVCFMVAINLNLCIKKVRDLGQNDLESVWDWGSVLFNFLSKGPFEIKVL